MSDVSNVELDDPQEVRDAICWRDNEIERLRERIEELENMGMVAGAAAPARDPRTIGGAGGSIPPHSHIITDAQIDAAWEERHDGVVEGIMFIPASEIGITACNRCHGWGVVPINEESPRATSKCPVCSGHGWTLRADTGENLTGSSTERQAAERRALKEVGK